MIADDWSSGGVRIMHLAPFDLCRTADDQVFRVDVGHVAGSIEIRFWVAQKGVRPVALETIEFRLGDGGTWTPTIGKMETGVSHETNGSWKYWRALIPVEAKEWHRIKGSTLSSVVVMPAGSVRSEMKLDPRATLLFDQALACIESMGLAPKVPQPVVDSELEPPSEAPVNGTSAEQGIVITRTITENRSDTTCTGLEAQEFAPSLLQPQVQTTIRTIEARPPDIKNGTRAELIALDRERVDSLCKIVEARNQEINTLYDRNKWLTETINQRSMAIGRLRCDSTQQAASHARMAGQPQNGWSDRCKVITEKPVQFGGTSVLTMLHAFSDPLELDTFRIITTRTAEGLRHELRITMGAGVPPHREQLFALALAGVADPTTEPDEELELLRVQHALSPASFSLHPVSSNEWIRSNDRDDLGLYYDASVEEVKNIFEDPTSIGFTFQSDPQQRKTLVFDKRTGRIVNVDPLNP